MIKPHTHKRTEIYKIQGFRVTAHVLAYRPIDNNFMDESVADWLKRRGKKKLTSDMEVEIPTLYGVSLL
jgi:hypothetical protein